MVLASFFYFILKHYLLCYCAQAFSHCKYTQNKKKIKPLLCLLPLRVVNTESYVDRSARRASRNAWKQSQCVASGQTITAKPPNYPFGNTTISQQSLNRSTSGLSYAQQIAQQSAQHQSSAVSISSGSVSSIASSLATSGPSGSLTVNSL